jgi:amino acid/amide ABC transporter ATP-binding protein 2, HAAT family (TC 3.A.1.4.-)
MSGGEQQMLAIARALIRDPKLILLDEPFEGLAPVIVQALVDVCRRLAESGQTILVVEHNIAAALTLSSRVYLMNNGHVVEERTSEVLKAQPEVLHRYLGIKHSASSSAKADASFES